MVRSALQPKRLLRVGKATHQLLQDWTEGVSLYRDSGLPIESLALRVASDRWVLAAAQRRDGNKLLGLSQPACRCSVSRYYYAMYHCMRAAAYVYHGGDDYQAHSKLPQHVPKDFPDCDDWANRLKNARLTRNAADYDPYPKSDKAWRRRASEIKSDADALLRVTREYLRERGCTLS